MTHLKSLRSIALLLALASPLFAAGVGAQDTTTPPASDPSAAPAEAPPTEGEAAPATTTATTTAAPDAQPSPDAPAPDAQTTTAAPDATTQAAPDAQQSSGDASQLATPSGDGSTQATTEDEAAAEEAQAAAEPLAWRNTFFSWTQGVTFNSFVRDGQLSYDPVYYHWFFINPRWYLDAQTFFVLGASGFIEVTDDDSSAYNHEFQLGDMTLELRRTIPWEGFVFIPSARLAFPVSKISQGAQRYLNTGLGVTVVRPIPEAAGMTLALFAGYRRWWAGSNVVVAQGADCVSTSRTTGDQEAFCNGATTTESDRFIVSLTINLTPVEGFTISLSGAWLWIQGYQTSPFTLASQPGIVLADPSMGGTLEDMGNHWRNFTSYSLFVAYDVAPWFNLSLGVANSTNLAPLYNDDGSVRSPFNPDTQVNLTAQFTLDGIYEELFGSNEDDGLTPEERQRRRQGLAENEDEDEQQQPSGASRSATTF